jgi:hypothetical protein
MISSGFWLIQAFGLSFFGPGPLHSATFKMKIAVIPSMIYCII